MKAREAILTDDSDPRHSSAEKQAAGLCQDLLQGAITGLGQHLRTQSTAQVAVHEIGF